MLQVKQDLLGALAAGLEGLLPGAGEKAAFESPKVAAHGDLACTAAILILWIGGRLALASLRRRATALGD